MVLSYIFAAGLFIMLVGLTSVFWVPALTQQVSRRLAVFYSTVLALFVLGFILVMSVGAVDKPVFTGLSTSFALFGILAWLRFTATGVILSVTGQV